jgi:dolichyl-phosphate beta-glucosyltransferase
MPHLSIVIPAYNEERRIQRTLGETFDYLDHQAYSSEIIVVDDGSNDRTAEVVLSFTARVGNRIRLINNPGNRGKGYAVRNGILHADGEIILFCDADMSTPPEETQKVIEPIQNRQYDIVFGSRALAGSRIEERQSGMREAIGRGGNFILQTLIGLPFQDTQCGFKAFSREAAHSTFSLQRIEGFGFDPEILYIAQKQGWRLLETPVRWSHVEGSKLNPLTTPLKVLLEVSTIRWNDLLGRYDAPTVTAAPHQ